MVASLIFALTLFQGLLAAAAALFLLWFLFLALPGLVNGPPFVGTSPERMRTMLQLAELKPSELVIDLGSGDGRLLAASARAGARAIGYEVNLFLVWRSRVRLWQQRLLRQAEVRWGNFWRADLRQADVVFIFGYSTIMARLERKLAAELRPGARFISYRYQLPTWPAEASRDHVYLYRISASSIEPRVG